MDKLDIISILKGSNNFPIKIGELKQEIIDILNLNLKPKNIIMHIERIYHCENHKRDFKSESSYSKSLRNIPLIINEPEYVGFNKTQNS